MLTVRTQKGMDALLWEATRKVFSDPVNVHDLMVAPQDYDVHQSGRVLELQNRDLWIRTTDLSRHFPFLVTIREMPFRTFRGRSSDKLKAREDKIEEAKKQKTLENRDEDWNSRNWKQSWTWNPSSSFYSSVLPEPQTKRVSVLIGNRLPIGVAQTRHASVPIGSELLGTAQIKRVRLRHGSRTIHGNDVNFIDAHKGIHGDENNVCL